MEEDRIELHSDEVQDIISRPPSSLIKYGITVIAAVVALVVIGSFIFRYPDVVQGRVVVTGDTPPNRIVARADGRLQELRLADGQQVSKGAIIAVVENTANTDDVVSVKQAVGKLSVSGEPIPFAADQSLRLGVVQDAYNQFCDAVVSYNQAVRLNIYRQQILSAQKEHASLLRHESNLKRQLEMSQQQADLVKHDRDREKSLHERKLTSDAEMEQSQRSLISAQLSVEQVRTDISQTQLSMAQIDNRLAELQVQYQQDMQHVTATLQSALNTLKVAIGQWEHLYALVAPASGKLSYTNVWAVNQNITTGQHIFSVVESRKSHFVGKVLLPATGFGKVKEGQRVNIMLDGYPYLEFGYLRGTVSSLSAVANQDVYVATISLPQGLHTTVGRELRFTGELSGQAEVITDDISLAVRIIQPLRYIFHHNV